MALSDTVLVDLTQAKIGDKRNYGAGVNIKLYNRVLSHLFLYSRASGKVSDEVVKCLR